MKRYISAILAAIVAVVAAFFSGYLGWNWQFFVVGLIYFIGGLYLIRNEDSKIGNIIRTLVLSVPFLILFGVNMFTKNLYHIYPIFFISILSVVLAWVFKSQFDKPVIPSIIYGLVLLATTFTIMPNWLNFTLDKNTNVNFEFPNIELADNQGNAFSIEKDKTYVFDLWSVTCKPCIEKFPDFEELSLEYENNSKVEFYAICLPVKGRNYNDKITKPYKFKSLYASSENSWELLNVQNVPKYLVVNNKSAIIYKGRLNDKWYHFYNNINSIINYAQLQ
ncbi:MAG: L-lactate permease [Bacteroidia bacterium]|nr:L-lactate permease [Bacteroidia bacterium]NNE15682.1 hypothetical protein [Saprospiraceae bacterium]NNK61378.1 hypothetical protein [Flavobacteriaceae bacterium]MBT8303433.1 L-lactate permease [Bacteroidia bacterium]MBT8310286.1 L-lactate permease [Bacteroidia bacterium]